MSPKFATLRRKRDKAQDKYISLCREYRAEGVRFYAQNKDALSVREIADIIGVSMVTLVKWREKQKTPGTP